MKPGNTFGSVRSVCSLALVFVALLFATSAYAENPAAPKTSNTPTIASFDCESATTLIEHAICEDQELYKLDEQLNRVYKKALSKVKNSKALRESQREWLTSTREKSAVAAVYGGKVNVYDLKHRYRTRITELGASFAALSTVLGSYTVLTPLTQVDPDKPGEGAFIQTGEHEDYVNLTQNADGNVQVSLWLTYGNGHFCEMDDIGVWKENHIVVERKSDSETTMCRLRIISDGNTVLLKDPEFNCSRMFCGARGSLDGTIVPRKQR